MPVIYQPTTGRAAAYLRSGVMAAKYLLSDGSVTDGVGIVYGPDVKRAKIWKLMPVKAAKWLFFDGSICDDIPGGSGGGALYVPDDFVFADDTARDAYFGANPDKLDNGIFCLSNGLLQKYVVDTWTDGTVAIKGGQGDPGKNIEIQNDGTNIQWRYVGDASWIDIVPLASLVGADGKSVNLRTNGGYIQWQRTGASTWTNLVTLASLKGEPGENGDDGDDGREVEIQNNGTSIQWRYVGDASWTDLIALSALKGGKGDTGQGVPDGGAAGQILVKASSDDFDTNWVDPPPGTGGVTEHSKLSGLTAEGSHPQSAITGLETRLGDIEGDISGLESGKVDKDGNKVLSTNDYSNTDKEIVHGLSAVAMSGSYGDLSGKPDIPDGDDYVKLTSDATQTVNSDISLTEGKQLLFNDGSVDEALIGYHDYGDWKAVEVGAEEKGITLNTYNRKDGTVNEHILVNYKTQGEGGDKSYIIPTGTEFDALSAKVQSIVLGGIRIGSYTTLDLRPSNISGFPAGITPTLSDFIVVQSDSDYGGARTQYYISAIDESAGDITWEYDGSFESTEEAILITDFTGTALSAAIPDNRQPHEIYWGASTPGAPTVGNGYGTAVRYDTSIILSVQVTSGKLWRGVLSTSDTAPVWSFIIDETSASDFIAAPTGQTANTQILLAPAVKGAAPTLKPVSDFPAKFGSDTLSCTGDELSDLLLSKTGFLLNDNTLNVTVTADATTAHNLNCTLVGGNLNISSDVPATRRILSIGGTEYTVLGAISNVTLSSVVVPTPLRVGSGTVACIVQGCKANGIRVNAGSAVSCAPGYSIPNDFSGGISTVYNGGLLILQGDAIFSTINVSGILSIETTFTGTIGAIGGKGIVIDKRNNGTANLTNITRPTEVVKNQPAISLTVGITGDFPTIQAALDSLNKNLSGNVTITLVSNVTGAVTLSGFIGSYDMTIDFAGFTSSSGAWSLNANTFGFLQFKNGAMPTTSVNGGSTVPVFTDVTINGTLGVTSCAVVAAGSTAMTTLATYYGGQIVLDGTSHVTNNISTSALVSGTVLIKDTNTYTGAVLPTTINAGLKVIDLRVNALDNLTSDRFIDPIVITSLSGAALDTQFAKLRASNKIAAVHVPLSTPGIPVGSESALHGFIKCGDTGYGIWLLSQNTGHWYTSWLAYDSASDVFPVFTFNFVRTITLFSGIQLNAWYTVAGYSRSETPFRTTGNYMFSGGDSTEEFIGEIFCGVDYFLLKAMSARTGLTYLSKILRTDTTSFATWTLQAPEFKWFKGLNTFGGVVINLGPNLLATGEIFFEIDYDETTGGNFVNHAKIIGQTYGLADTRRGQMQISRATVPLFKFVRNGNTMLWIPKSAESIFPSVRVQAYWVTVEANNIPIIPVYTNENAPTETLMEIPEQARVVSGQGSKSITVGTGKDYATLQAAISSLKKSIDGDIQITVYEDQVGDLSLYGFVGAYSITINGGNFTIARDMGATVNNYTVNVKNAKITGVLRNYGGSGRFDLTDTIVSGTLQGYKRAYTRINTGCTIANLNSENDAFTEIAGTSVISLFAQTGTGTLAIQPDFTGTIINGTPVNFSIIDYRPESAERYTPQIFNGRRVFKKLFTGNIVVAASTESSLNLLAGNYNIVKAEGWWQVGATSKFPVVCNFTDATGNFVSVIYASGSNIVFRSKTYNPRAGTTNNEYQITVYYTKNA